MPRSFLGVLGSSSPSASKDIASLPIGSLYLGGYYAGIIDTTASSGLRYAVLCSPKSLETTALWKTPASSDPFPQSVWDGLATTTSMINNVSSTYPAASYCYSLSFPNDGASRWYLPARDELELIYRNLKPNTNSNVLNGLYGPNGVNPSSSPVGAAYTGPVPAQTSVVDFRAGGSQALNTTDYWCTTAISDLNAVSISMNNGSVAQSAKSGSSRVRPVRRIIL